MKRNRKLMLCLRRALSLFHPMLLKRSGHQFLAVREVDRGPSKACDLHKYPRRRRQLVRTLPTRRLHSDRNGPLVAGSRKGRNRKFKSRRLRTRPRRRRRQPSLHRSGLRQASRTMRKTKNRNLTYRQSKIKSKPSRTRRRSPGQLPTRLRRQQLRIRGLRRLNNHLETTPRLLLLRYPVMAMYRINGMSRLRQRT